MFVPARMHSGLSATRSRGTQCQLESSAIASRHCERSEANPYARDDDVETGARHTLAVGARLDRATQYSSDSDAYGEAAAYWMPGRAGA